MKKIFYLVAAAMIVSFSAAANETISNDNCTGTVYSSNWSPYSSVRLYFFGNHVKGTAAGTYNVEYDSETGQYRIYYKDRWYYNVRSSDRDGFRFMFSADRVYYFN